MKRNQINTAPYLPDFNGVFEKWQSTHRGDRQDFYEFITRPSAERDEFLITLKRNPVFTEQLAVMKFEIC